MSTIPYRAESTVLAQATNTSTSSQASHGLDEWEKQRREFKGKVDATQSSQSYQNNNSMTIDQLDEVINEIVGFNKFELPNPARLDVMVESLAAEWGSLEDDDHDPTW